MVFVLGKGTSLVGWELRLVEEKEDADEEAERGKLEEKRSGGWGMSRGAREEEPGGS